MLDRVIDMVRNAVTMRSLDPGTPIVDAAKLSQMIQGDQTVVAMFYADWCGFCARFMPAFQDHAADLPGTVVAVNISSNSDPLWDAFDIRAVPTLLAFRDGAPVARADAVPGRGLTADHLDALAAELSK